MKKFGTILLALVMVFALAACAAGTESTESSDSAVSSQSSSEASRTSAEPQEQNSSETPSEAGNESDASVEATSEPTDSTDSSSEQEPEGSKILVAYFSATNNTEGVAQKLADGLDADLYEITPSEPYTDADLNYNNSGSRSSVEMNDPSARPAIFGNGCEYGTVRRGVCRLPDLIWQYRIPTKEPPRKTGAVIFLAALGKWLFQIHRGVHP